MLKYLYTKVVFQEVPDEISLAIGISNCPFKCKGCHSPELWEDKGKELTLEEIDRLIKDNKGISCICFMGGDADETTLHLLAHYVKIKHKLKTAWYSGYNKLPEFKYLQFWDYIKIGSYIEEFGGLESKTTNQRFYKIVNNQTINITSRFYEKSI